MLRKSQSNFQNYDIKKIVAQSKKKEKKLSYKKRVLESV